MDFVRGLLQITKYIYQKFSLNLPFIFLNIFYFLPFLFLNYLKIECNVDYKNIINITVNVYLESLKIKLNVNHFITSHFFHVTENIM